MARSSRCRAERHRGGRLLDGAVGALRKGARHARRHHRAGAAADQRAGRAERNAPPKEQAQRTAQAGPRTAAAQGTIEQLAGATARPPRGRRSDAAACRAAPARLSKHGGANRPLTRARARTIAPVPSPTRHGAARRNRKRGSRGSEPAMAQGGQGVDAARAQAASRRNAGGGEEGARRISPGRPSD